MSTCVYLVINSLGAWWVDREGKNYGPCETREEALESAFKLISLFHEAERPAEVWAPDEDGKMKLIWSSRSATEAQDAMTP